MPATAADIKFYNSLAPNGGGIDETSEIVTNVLHNLIKATTASESELGATKYFKFYIKNTSAVDSLVDPILAVSMFSSGDDYIQVIKSSTDNSTSATESFDTLRAYGVAITTGELNRLTRTVPISLENPAVVNDIFKPGDHITFYRFLDGDKLVSATIESVSSTQLTVVQDIPASILLEDSYVGSSLKLPAMGPGEFVGIWIKQVIAPFSAKELNNTSRLTFYFDPA